MDSAGAEGHATEKGTRPGLTPEAAGGIEPRYGALQAPA